ncbi:hypothetical protein XELAEV_18002461mg [Xenopus laevis]|nr:hypothetical protein XELAEV_18002461mg [Xenopus laevis]
MMDAPPPQKIWRAMQFVFENHQILPHSAIKKATVFLNLAACKGKAMTLFEKNAAPILHLAGIDITLVKTDYEGQAKNLLELMEKTDLIIVAGGDGTLQEVITGLLRREGQVPLSKIPIAFIPLEGTNTLSHTLYPERENKVQQITEAALSILKGETVALDILQIKGEQDQPVFAVQGIRWGSYRDASLKSSNLSPWQQPRYLLEPVNSQHPRTLDSMSICTEPDAISKGQFIQLGVEKMTDPLLPPGDSQVLLASRCSLHLPQGTEGHFSIDSEEYEAMSVDVTLLPRKLHFLCHPTRKQELLQRPTATGHC